MSDEEFDYSSEEDSGGRDVDEPKRKKSKSQRKGVNQFLDTALDADESEDDIDDAEIAEEEDEEMQLALQRQDKRRAADADMILRLEREAAEEQARREKAAQAAQATKASSAQAAADSASEPDEEATSRAHDLDDEEAADGFIVGDGADEYVDRAQPSSSGARDYLAHQRTELQPSHGDVPLWAVACMYGREEEAAMSLMRKHFIKSRAGTPLRIKSVTAYKPAKMLFKPGVNSYIYIEAWSKQDILEAIDGLEAITGRYSQKLIDQEERPAILSVRKPLPSVRKGQWVRIKRGLYQNDLAKVIGLDSRSGKPKAIVELVPRIDTSPADSQASRKARPIQRLFNAETIRAELGGAEANEVEERSGYFLYQGKRYYSGFLRDTFNLSSLQTPAQPSIDELAFFETTATADDFVETAPIEFARGDKVVVIQGGLKNAPGIVQSMDEKNCQIKLFGDKMESQNLVVSVAKTALSKFCVINDHVRVTRGVHKGETGLVVKASMDSPVVTIMPDYNTHEVFEVLVRDTEATKTVSYGLESLGTFGLYKLVQFNNSKRHGCIVRISAQNLHVLTESGQLEQVKPQEVRLFQVRGRPEALDSFGNRMQINSMVTITRGPHQGKDAQVKHIIRYTVFCHVKSLSENAGYIVCNNRDLRVAGASANRATGHASPSGASVQQQRSGPKGGRMQRRQRDPLLNKTVRIIKGVNKSKIGTVKSINNNVVRIVVQSTNKIISASRDIVKEISTKREDYASSLATSDATAAASFGDQTPGHTGDETPFLRGSETPHLTSGADSVIGGSATPGYDPSDSAWDATTANTPGVTSDQFGSDLPAESPMPGYSAPTPPYHVATGNAPTPSAYGSTPSAAAYSAPTPSTPGYSATTPGGSGYNAQTPAGGSGYNAQTPAGGYSAQTPGAYSATTPGAYSAPTPGASGYSATTPAGYSATTPANYSAATPGGAGYSASTPAAYQASTPGYPQTPGYGSGYADDTSSGYPMAQTPGVHNAPGIGADAPAIPAWCHVGVHVMYRNDEYVIVSVQEDTETATVMGLEGESQLQAEVSELIIAPLEANDKVYVFDGDLGGRLGKLVSIESGSAQALIEDGAQLFLAPVHYVAKFSTIQKV
eukprot:m.228852 g.228852  ORF g.228852 m.228852 type:complete len:1116 (-) comp15196_c2_seq1:1201-4548(-)